MVIWRCQQFLAEIARETTDHRFNYAELDELEEDLTKLCGWSNRAHARDVHVALRADEADKAITECIEALAGFREQVTPRISLVAKWP